MDGRKARDRKGASDIRGRDHHRGDRDHKGDERVDTADQTPGVPRAQVSEKDGEISCSVEETNRIRAALGLKPLRIDSKDDAQEQIRQNIARAEREARQAEAIARIEKAKKKRLLHAKMSGVTLGDQDNEDDLVWSTCV